MDTLAAIFYIALALAVLIYETYSLMHKNWQAVGTKFAFAEGTAFGLSIAGVALVLYKEWWVITFIFSLRTR